MEYGGGYYDGDDPRLRRDADYYRRNNELPPGAEGAPREELRAAEAVPGSYGQDPAVRADEGAERSDVSGPNAEYRQEGERVSPTDVTGPNAEYRNSEAHPEHGGGRR
ncbi:MAG: hypothetical protein R3E50_06745 [Halioglobus sp.]